MQQTLYRAFAYIRQNHEAEVCVFFEKLAGNLTPTEDLHLMLALAWNVSEEQIESYNCSTETELLANSIGLLHDGDSRLFEINQGDRGSLIQYVQPSRTLFFVRPSTLSRLVDAQHESKVLALLYSTRHGKEVLRKHWGTEQGVAS